MYFVIVYSCLRRNGNTLGRNKTVIIGIHALIIGVLFALQ